MPLPDLHQAIQTAASQIRTFWAESLPDEVSAFLENLQNSQTMRDDYFQVLPEATQAGQGKPSDQPDWWNGRVPDVIRAAAAGSSANLLMFTIYRDTAWENGAYANDARTRRFEFVRVYIKPLNALETELFASEGVQAMAENLRQGLVSDVFKHMIAHELMHVVGHFSWNEQVPVEFKGIAQQINVFAREIMIEGVPECLTRLTRGVEIQARYPLFQDGYGYPMHSLYIQHIRPSIFMFGGEEWTIGRFIDHCYFRGLAPLGDNDWEDACALFWQRIHMTIAEPPT